MLLLSLIIAEAALETVPKSIARHPSVVKHAAKIGKSADKILLDRSYHHRAMLKLKDNAKRGRPDLVHFALLEAISTPLYIKNLVKVYVHTIANKVIFINDGVRLPKSYFRFEGLMEELFQNKKVKGDDRILLELRDLPFCDLLELIKPANVIGLSRVGVRSSAGEVAKKADNNAALVVGGFSRGHFSKEVSKKIQYLYSITDFGLEAHAVIARVLYECEKLLL